DYILTHESQLPFERNGRKAIHKGVTNAIWWVKFPLKNTSEETVDLLVEIGNPDINQLQLFVAGEDYTTQSMLTGDAFSFAERPIEHRHFLFPIRLLPKEAITVYLMSDKHSEAYMMPVELWNKQTFLEQDSHSSLLYGIYTGLLVVYVFVPLLLVVFFRKRILFYYFLLALSLSLYILATTGFAFQFFWSDAHPLVNRLVRPFLSGMIALFLVLLASELFHSRASGARLLKALDLGKQAYLLVLIVGVFVGGYSLLVGHTVWNNLLLGLQAVMILVLIVLILIIAAQEFRKRRSIELAGLMAVVVMQLSVFVLGTLNNFGLLNSGPDFHNLLIAGLSLELLIISVILLAVYRQTFAEKQKLQQEHLSTKWKIAQQLLQGQEKERFRITSDLQQQLRPLLKRINSFLNARHTEGISEPFRKMKTLLADSEAELEKISNNLLPESLISQSLGQAIRAHCDMINETESLELQFVNRCTSYALSDQQKINAFRIVQELLNNVLQHAQATHVNVLLSMADAQLMIEVEDNGIGLPAGAGRFSIVRERVVQLQGDIQ
ncbi:MAG: 7TM-DISM domain-containing protein, partial [Bacteroidota bacterium]